MNAERSVIVRRKMRSKEECFGDLKLIPLNFFNDESGQDLIEYALVVCIIALGTVAAMTSFASTVRTALGSMGTKLTSAI